MPQVSVALPVRHAAATLERAIQAITNQTLADFELLLVLNGSDNATTSLAREAARRDPRIRVLSLPAPNLAAALNLALREARADLVARMDADDECHSGRLALQREFLLAHPDLAGVGCAFEVVEAASGRVLATQRPPADPHDLRWRLLLGNPLCHGAMMLRRERVLAAGGYDERRLRAQDYELWLRLSGLLHGDGAPRPPALANLPEVLYRYHVASAAAFSSSPLQAASAAELLVEAWRALPRGLDDDLTSLMGDALAEPAGPGEALDGIESLLQDGPNLSALAGWLWTRWHFPPAHHRAVEAGRLSRMREVGRALRDAGARAITLWGAGAHTAWLLTHVDQLGLPVAGIVDDALAGGQRYGFRIAHPTSLAPGQHVLLSSDWHEDSLWAASDHARARGVRVHRLYA